MFGCDCTVKDIGLQICFLTAKEIFLFVTIAHAEGSQILSHSKICFYHVHFDSHAIMSIFKDILINWVHRIMMVAV